MAFITHHNILSLPSIALHPRGGVHQQEGSYPVGNHGNQGQRLLL